MQRGAGKCSLRSRRSSTRWAASVRSAREAQKSGPRGHVARDRASSGAKGGNVIPAERILGKFTRAGCERPTAETESTLVTKTRGCPEGENLSRRGGG